MPSNWPHLLIFSLNCYLAIERFLNTKHRTHTHKRKSKRNIHAEHIIFISLSNFHVLVLSVVKHGITHCWMCFNLHNRNRQIATQHNTPASTIHKHVIQLFQAQFNRRNKSKKKNYKNKTRQMPPNTICRLY